MPYILPDFQEDSLAAVTDKLVEAGYNTYLTSVGGSGLGVYPVSGDPSNLAQDNLKQVFINKAKIELASWAESQGGWLYV